MNKLKKLLGIPSRDDLDRAIAGARDVDDVCSMEGAMAALRSCVRHCTVCDGLDHHWLPECDDDGEPVMVCKHCPAWREMTATDLDDVGEEDSEDEAT